MDLAAGTAADHSLGGRAIPVKILRNSGQAPSRLQLMCFSMIVLFATSALCWNSLAHLSWDPPGPAGLLFLVSPCWLVAAYCRWRGEYRLQEVSSLFGLLFVSIFFGERLTYLAATLDFPLIDSRLMGFDESLGFHWGSWKKIVDSNQPLMFIHMVFYPSQLFQVAASVVVFAYAKVEDRNYEMLAVLQTGLLLTAALSGVFPAFGPAVSLGFHTGYADIIQQLRTHSSHRLPYTALVSFPSYHTQIALTLIYAHRGCRSFLPFFWISLLTLITVPYGGHHTLADMAGGAVVTAISIAAVRGVIPTREKPALATQGRGAAIGQGGA